jgi:acyl-[acyl-carrier-protein]-phospholipid O-acyltransferase/long-chain-fatty-acid--[acyl-carrier-protein] ligase
MAETSSERGETAPEALTANAIVETFPQKDSAPREHAALPASHKGFWSLIITQFQGAFSDNVLKNLVIFLALTQSASVDEQHALGEKVTAIFSLPFILFSMAGGFLADRFSKRSVMLGVKVFEIAVMAVVITGFASHNLHVLLAAIFLMGTHSAFFGPSKYSSLPELLPEKELSWGNGILELGTFMAIILGTVLAGLLAQKLGREQVWSGVILSALAVAGLAACLGITKVPAAAPNKKLRLNFVADLRDRLVPIWNDRPLVLAFAGNIYFSFLGSLLLLNLFFYGYDVLHVSQLQIGLLNVALALGIGIGSVAAGFLSGGKIEYGLVPIGAFGMAAICATLGVEGLSLRAALLRLALLGFFGGFFIVPVSALLQHRPEKHRKGEVLAAANLLSFVGVFLVWPAHYLLAQVLHWGPLKVFLFGAVLTFVGAVIALWLLPEALLRFVLWLLTRTLYRIKVLGRDNVPERGGALLVCNHLSHVDALLLQASIDRPIRFLMFKGIYELPYVKPLARVMGVIPISSEQRPREMLKSLQTASDAIKAGELVCIFAEGQITRIGQLLPFRRGFERIMKDVTAPIIPVALDGVWGSIFSFEHKRFLWKVPRRVPYPITASFGPGLPAHATPSEVRHAVQELVATAWLERKARMQTLDRELVRTSRRHPFRFAMADGQTKKVNFIAVLIRTIILARRLRKNWEGQQMVGILLPPSVGGALVNFAAVLLGKAAVNLNYTVSESTLKSCLEQCSIKTVVGSKAFLEKVKLQIPGQTIFLEDVVTGDGGAMERLTSAFLAVLAPYSILIRILRGQRIARAAERIDELATVIFSSGSTGEPKGVMLTHYNIAANIAQMEQVFGLTSRDKVLGILPFFHSFGFTGTLWMPAVVGIGAVYHSNPLDAKTIGPLVQDYGITFLLATPTFLQLYLRGCSPENFGSLRLVMTGAEKLPERLASAFDEHFGIRPLEGYGCTECSPAVAVNTHDFRASGFRQVGAKRGKIGHPLPGVSVRICDPENPHSKETLPVGTAGLMLVRGPNVMQGYLGRPEKTAEVLRDGWYVTGDVAALDEDGFLQITDRLNRFSKIGGEMVPHIKVEEKLHELAGLTEQAFVVTGVPDEKKGERLVVLHRLKPEQLQPCIEKLAQSDLPNLWKPRPEQFIYVEALPYLGTGKLDLRKVKELALQGTKEAGLAVAPR